jgi:carboxyl-terminal processing protease
MGPAQTRQRGLRHPAPATEVEALRARCPPGEVADADLAAVRALALDPLAHAAAVAR